MNSHAALEGKQQQVDGQKGAGTGGKQLSYSPIDRLLRRVQHLRTLNQ